MYGLTVYFYMIAKRYLYRARMAEGALDEVPETGVKESLNKTKEEEAPRSWEIFTAIMVSQAAAAAAVVYLSHNGTEVITRCRFHKGGGAAAFTKNCG